MRASVVDPSIMAACFFQEARADEAAAILLDTEFHAPKLLAYELASVARKKILERRSERELIERALEVVLSQGIFWSDVVQTEVLMLALETGLSTYDARYLYLARRMGVPLATFDQQLLRVAQRLAH